MKALFYLLDGDTNASSYRRALQFFPRLRDYDIDASASRPVPQPVYERLVERGRAGPPGKLAFYGLFLASRLVDVLRAGRYDVVVVQRDLFPFGPPVLERLLRRLNPRLVFDTDDAVYLRPSFTPDTVFQRLRRFDKVEEVVRHARWVTVATQPIAAWARRFSAHVTVLPMSLDPAPYEAARRAAASPGAGSPVVIGWTGTAGSVQYLEALAPVLRDLAQRLPVLVRAVSGASANVRLPGVPLDARPWRPGTSLQDLASFDLGLVPLRDEPFERQKFPFKMLEYLALGVPAVCSRLGSVADVITDGENGLLAASAEEWRQQLEWLVGDAKARRRLGEAGRQTLYARYTLDHTAPALADVLRRVAAE